MNIHSSLIAELRDKTYRDAYVASQIAIGLPFQVRALRQARDWTQTELAERAVMSQPRIAEIEKPARRRFNLDTLLRVASALDVGLEVRFVPISEIIDHDEAFDPDSFNVPSFEEELRRVETAAIRKIEAQQIYDLLISNSASRPAAPTVPNQKELMLSPLNAQTGAVILTFPDLRPKMPQGTEPKAITPPPDSGAAEISPLLLAVGA